MTEEKKQEFKLRITQANPTQLTVITYELALAYLEDARAVEIHPGEGDDYLGTKTEYREALKKVRGCVEELSNSLDTNYELSGTLMSLYVYIEKELGQAEVTCDKSHLDIVEKVLTDLHDAFSQIQDQDKRDSVVSNAQNVYAGLTYGRDDVNETVSGDPARGYLA